RERLGIDLRTKVKSQVADDFLVAGDESAYSCEAFREGSEIDIYLVLNAEVFAGAGSRSAHGADAMGIVDEEAEVVFLFVGYNFVKCSEVAGHAEYTLSDNQDASSGFSDDVLCMLELLFEAFHVIVRVHKPF